jgi:hypothetical protein
MTDSPRIAPDFDDCENSTDDEQQLSGEPIVKPKPTETESEVKVDEAIRDIEVAPKKTKKRKAKGLAPKNNYSLFQEDVRKAGFPDDVKGFVASSRHIADLWNNAPDEIKDEYTKKALEYNKSLPKPEDQGDEEQQQEPKKKAKKSASKKEPKPRSRSTKSKSKAAASTDSTPPAGCEGASSFSQIVSPGNHNLGLMVPVGGYPNGCSTRNTTILQQPPRSPYQIWKSYVRTEFCDNRQFHGLSEREIDMEIFQRWNDKSFPVEQKNEFIHIANAERQAYYRDLLRTTATTTVVPGTPFSLNF